MHTESAAMRGARRRQGLNTPRFLCRSHVYQWTSQMLRTARAVYGDSREYHLIVKHVLIEKRRALKAFQPAPPPSP